MKTKYEIQRGFDSWLAEEANAYGLTAEQRENVRIEIMKEVDWLIRNANFMIDLPGRILKFDTLIAASETGDISDFDPYWRYRKDFWTWIGS